MLVETTHLTEFECYISLADVVMCVKFLVNRFRGYRVLTPQNCHFPLTCCVALTTVYSLPCDTVIIASVGMSRRSLKLQNNLKTGND